MKNRATFSKSIAVDLFSLMLVAPMAMAAAPTNSPPAQSVFTIPTNARQGRDPFFPASQRPYEGAPAAPGSIHTDLANLTMQGVSGPLGHRLAIINNVTFGEGDTAEVRTPQGRIRIRCIEITGDDTVVVEAGGQRQALHYHQP
jgi:hypothetical protein